MNTPITKTKRIKKPFFQSNKVRYLTFWGSVLTGRVAPVLIVGWQFGFFKEEIASGTKLTGGFIIALLILGFSFYKDILAWVKTLPGAIRNTPESIKLLKWLIIALIICLVAYFAVESVINFLIYWIACETATIPLKNIHEKHVPEDVKLARANKAKKKEEL